MNSRKKEGQSHKRGINATKLITVGGMRAYRMSIMGQKTGTVEEIAGFPDPFSPYDHLGRDDLPRIAACFGSEADMVSRLRMSVLPLKAGIRQSEWHARYLPEADISPPLQFG